MHPNCLVKCENNAKDKDKKYLLCIALLLSVTPNRYLSFKNIARLHFDIDVSTLSTDIDVSTLFTGDEHRPPHR